MTEDQSSIEEAGGVAVGFAGFITNYNADAQARLANALLDVGKWVEKEAGVLLGHIKCSVFLEDGTGVTLNLISIEEGVEVHGTIEPSERVGFNILCAVLDVDKAALDHEVHHALDDSFLDIELTSHKCHCDNHAHHDHDHKHEHDNGHHDHDCGCKGCHGHEGHKHH